ncbi:acyltransferase [uncultured Thiohalocapsa sp.]|uniref:acyltransferase family protein n=1 Tax=uncultured Thiohalocapsa sp. TaxID=768990 RepID=UPI0026001F48|nr:acyltransferase [uncultured Thiohalocapsa sp.]
MADTKQIDGLTKYAYIDALRGWAILGVILVHSSQRLADLPPILHGLFQTGQYGVQLFFVASALTLALSLSKRRDQDRFPIQDYFIRRFFRIAPLYYAAIVLYFFVHGLSSGQWPPPSHFTSAVGLNVLFLHAWNQYTVNSVVPGGWSISVEMTFYLLVPLLLSVIRDLRGALIATGLALLLSVTAAYAMHLLAGLPWPVPNNSFLYYWLPTQLPVFMLGFALFFLIRDTGRSGARPAADSPRASLVRLAVAAALFGIGAATMSYSALAAPVVFGTAAVFFAWALALHPWPLFVNRLLCHLGELSFSLYVVHFVFAWYLAPSVIQLLTGPAGLPEHWAWSMPVSVGLTLLLSAATATLTNRWIEQPGIDSGRRLIGLLEGRRKRLRATG